MSYTTSSNFANKSLPELLEDIYERINRLENNMLGIKPDNKPVINVSALKIDEILCLCPSG